MSKKPLTDAQKAAEAEYKRRRLAAMTPQQRAEFNAKHLVRARRRKAARTPEQVEKDKAAERVANKLRYHSLTLEQRKRRYEISKVRLIGFSETQMAAYKSRRARTDKRWLASLTPDKVAVRRVQERKRAASNPTPSHLSARWGVDPEVIKAYPELRQALVQLIKTRRTIRNGKKSLKNKLRKHIS